MAFYSSKYKSIDEVPNGATIAIPNDTVNGGRALLLLEANGLIELKDDALDMKLMKNRYNKIILKILNFKLLRQHFPSKLL